MIYLKRETETPDLWAAFSAENALLQNGGATEPSDNLPFTPAELPQVQKCLEEIKTYVIKTKDLTETQRKIIDARVDHMEEAAPDWAGKIGER